MSTATQQRSFNDENYMAATEIAERNGAPDASNPLAIIQLAVQQNAEPGQLRELLELQREWAKDRAAEAFGAAITKFQQLCPRVHKSRQVNAGPLKYQYASFDDVMEQASPHLTACGIAVSFSTEANDRGIRVTTRLRVGIHFEDSTLDVPVPDMKVNNTQRYGAALQYAKRYGMCAALNIVVTDDVDDDANSCFETVTEEQAVQIQEWIDQKSVNPKRFLEWAGVDSVYAIPASKYQQAIDFLRRK